MSLLPLLRFWLRCLTLSKHAISDGLKYLFTIVDHFIKYGSIVSLKDKTSKNMLGTFRKYITTLQTDNGTEFENSTMN